jgi:transcriptional regulator with XRE-family HTH domain
MTRPLSLRQSDRVKRGLRFLMAQRYPTQRELAAAIGVSQKAVSAVLAGRTLGGMKLARGVARCLAWDLDVLLSSNMPVEPPPSDPAPATIACRASRHAVSRRERDAYRIRPEVAPAGVRQTIS